MTVKRAHMVSKGYIRAWADERNIVDVLDLQDGRGYPSSYLSATVVSYGYDPKVLTHDLEQDYSYIENSGTPAIVKLRNGHTLTAAERSAVARPSPNPIDLYSSARCWRTSSRTATVCQGFRLPTGITLRI